jgi:WD40 repeat protein
LHQDICAAVGLDLEGLESRRLLARGARSPLFRNDVLLAYEFRWAACGAVDGTVRLWETAGGRLMRTLLGHTGGVSAVALSSNGHLLASSSLDGTVRHWQTGTGSPLRSLRPDRRYERLDITWLTGTTDAQRGTLLALGAIERRGPPTAESAG